MDYLLRNGWITANQGDFFSYRGMKLMQTEVYSIIKLCKERGFEVNDRKIE